MKKALALLLAAAIGVSLLSACYAAEPGSSAKSTSADITFQDVSTSNWAYPYIALAASNGWVRGNGPDSFNPTGTVSYAELATRRNRRL